MIYLSLLRVCLSLLHAGAIVAVALIKKLRLLEDIIGKKGYRVGIQTRPRHPRPHDSPPSSPRPAGTEPHFFPPRAPEGIFRQTVRYSRSKRTYGDMFQSPHDEGDHVRPHEHGLHFGEQPGAMYAFVFLRGKFMLNKIIPFCVFMLRLTQKYFFRHNIYLTALLSAAKRSAISSVILKSSRRSFRSFSASISSFRYAAAWFAQAVLTVFIVCSKFET
mmetsp:Transcript_40835/g.95803  ORF Transcript_40835/g.95803 Transcript_40835/m.95803 type:complete len:218 (+) Transcript_40835:234-887(+)